MCMSNILCDDDVLYEDVADDGDDEEGDDDRWKEKKMWGFHLNTSEQNKEKI